MSRYLHLDTLNKYISQSSPILHILFTQKNPLNKLEELLMNKYVVPKHELFLIFSCSRISMSLQIYSINKILDFNYQLDQTEYNALCNMVSVRYAVINNLEITSLHILTRIKELINHPRKYPKDNQEVQYITDLLNSNTNLLEKVIETIKSIPGQKEYKINMHNFNSLLPELKNKKN